MTRLTDACACELGHRVWDLTERLKTVVACSPGARGELVLRAGKRRFVVTIAEAPET